MIREALWLLRYGRFVFRFVCDAAAFSCEALGEHCGGGVQAVGLDFGLGERVDEAGVSPAWVSRSMAGETPAPPIKPPKVSFPRDIGITRVRLIPTKSLWLSGNLKLAQASRFPRRRLQAGGLRS